MNHTLATQDLAPDSSPVENRHHGDSSRSSSLEEKDRADQSSDQPPDDTAQAVTENPRRPELQRVQSQAEGMGTFRIFVIMFSLCLALFLAALDVTIITTALPTIADHFKATAADYTWIGSAYLLANAASTPLWGKLSDIWGRKPIILLANLVFMVGSLVCALSNSIGMLIGGRVIQGIGGGGLIILVNICISDLFSMRERAKYFGIVGMTWAIASALGPVLGGVFTQRVSWRWCFYINLPLDGAAFINLIIFLRIETPKTPFMAGIKAIDWLGVLTIIGGVVMFLFGMESGGESHPWSSAFTLCLIIFGIATVVLFFINEWKFAKYPIMPLRLFSDWSNVAALGVVWAHGFVFIAGSYYLPLYFQSVLGASPILSGVYLFPLALSLSFMSAGTGIFIKRTGLYRPAIWFGATMMTLGFGLFIDFGPKAQWAKIIIFQIIAGMGVGPNFQSPLIALQSHVKGHDIATATALYGFVRNLSTSVSVVIGGVIFQNQLAKKEGVLRAALGPKLARLISRSSFGSTTALIRSLPKAQKDVVDSAFTDSLRDMWIFYVCIAALGVVISLFITKKTLSTQHEKARTGIEEQERVRKEVKEDERVEREEKRRRKDERRGTAGGGGSVVSPSPPGTASGEMRKEEV